MEAAVMDRKAEMTEWNDGRLNEFGERVDRIERKVDDGFREVGHEFTRLDQKIDEQGKTMQGEFARIDQKFVEIDGGFKQVDSRFQQVDERFKWVGERFDEMVLHFGKVESELVRVNDRLDDFHRSMIWVAWTMAIGLLGLIGVLTGIIATK
jgi:DNA anti-recombination protein RmuC